MTYHRRDLRQEDELVAALHRRPAEEQLAVLRHLVDAHLAGLHPVALRVVNDRRVAVSLFDEWLARADASSIDEVLRFGLVKLGPRRALAAVAERAAAGPRLIDWAEYSLRSDHEHGAELIALLRELSSPPASDE